MDGLTGFRPPPPNSGPKAVAVMDPFHIVRLAGDALDQCRWRPAAALHCGLQDPRVGADAEDVLQETWLPWAAVEQGTSMTRGPTSCGLRPGSRSTGCRGSPDAGRAMSTPGAISVSSTTAAGPSWAIKLATISSVPLIPSAYAMTFALGRREHGRLPPTRHLVRLGHFEPSK